MKVEGLEHLPEKSNFIVVANHTSFLDPIVIGVAIPKRIYWVAFRKIYNTFWLRWLMAISKALPTGNSSQKALNLLGRNCNVGIFPEGSRSHDGQLKEFRRGAALLALKTGRLIVPCAIFGTYKALPKKAKFPRPAAVKLKVGRPIHLLKEHGDIVDDICLQEGTLRVRNTIKEMIDAG